MLVKIVALFLRKNMMQKEIKNLLNANLATKHRGKVFEKGIHRKIAKDAAGFIRAEQSDDSFCFEQVNSFSFCL